MESGSTWVRGAGFRKPSSTRMSQLLSLPSQISGLNESTSQALHAVDAWHFSKPLQTEMLHDRVAPTVLARQVQVPDNGTHWFPAEHEKPVGHGPRGDAAPQPRPHTFAPSMVRHWLPVPMQSASTPHGRQSVSSSARHWVGADVGHGKNPASHTSTAHLLAVHWVEVACGIERQSLPHSPQ